MVRPRWASGRFKYGWRSIWIRKLILKYRRILRRTLVQRDISTDILITFKSPRLRRREMEMMRRNKTLQFVQDEAKCVHN